MGDERGWRSDVMLEVLTRERDRSARLYPVDCSGDTPYYAEVYCGLGRWWGNGIKLGEHMASCWNACAGLTPDELAGGVVPRAVLDEAMALLERAEPCLPSFIGSLAAEPGTQPALRPEIRAFLARCADTKGGG